MLKWGRNYKVVFEIGYREENDITAYVPQEEITVQYPTTLHLNMTSGINTGEVGQCSIQLYNLNEAVRTKLWKDNFDNKKYITMYLYAGYQDNMPLIFRGDVQQSYSYREEGGVDYITDIQSEDGSYVLLNGVANGTYAKDTDIPNIIQDLLKDVPFYTLGYTSKKLKPLRKSRTYIGKVMDLIQREYGDYDVYIDKGELNILADNEVVPGYLPVITAESGLLGSPRRQDTLLIVRTLFEPRLILGQAIELISDSLPFLNQYYKVISIAHQGTISPVECGKLITTVTLSLGDKVFNELQKTEPSTYGGQATSGKWLKPVTGTVTSPFGRRTAPKAGASTYHKGIDIGAPLNTTVTAPANGKVKFVGWVRGYGKYISIDHGLINGKAVVSEYGHLNGYTVSSNQTVSAGQQIGLVGSTGNSTGPHLHFGIMENGNFINPITYIGSY